MTTRYYEAVVDSLMKMCADLGECPRELALSTRVYLNVAADLQGFAKFAGENSRFPTRVAHNYLARIPFGAPDPTQTLDDVYREVRVGDSFVIHGPRGPVTIRESKD